MARRCIQRRGTEHRERNGGIQHDVIEMSDSVPEHEACNAPVKGGLSADLIGVSKDSQAMEKGEWTSKGCSNSSKPALDCKLQRAPF